MNSLNSAHILITRPTQQADTLCDLIQQQGGVAIHFPTVDIVAHNDNLTIQSKLTQLEQVQWLVFISANAVNFAVKANGGKISAEIMPRIVAIGPATARTLHSIGLTVDLIPTAPYTSEALLAMPEMQTITGQIFLLVRGNSGREKLADTLRSRGAIVDDVAVYKRIISNIDNQFVLTLLAAKKLAVITITSVEILRNLLILLDNNQQLFTIPLVVISERIKCVALEMGFKQVAVAEHPSDAAILDAVTTYVTGG